MKSILGILSLIAFYLFGEWLSTALALAIPGSIVGLLLLLFLQILLRKTPSWIQSGTEISLPYLPLFIIPASVGVVMYLELLAEHAMALTLAMVISLVVGFVAVVYSMLFSRHLSLSDTGSKEGRNE